MKAKLLRSAAIAAALVLLATQSAAAADGRQEINTAALHASMAANASDQKTVQAHLHHVINCLVGPHSADYNSAEADPCKGQGAGAIPDSPADKQKDLNSALSMARLGLAQTDLTKAKEQAGQIQATLKKAAM